ncbi:MAG: DUF1704 domain-containing protein, partial [Candidatus Peribacteraceae bacterium]|nr:DUF1704 domain-containing protein [Candidatus Peribacteraceae bacterium]
LDGKFSLGGRRDTAFFEQILYPHECFTPFRPVGLPDIRVIVFNLVPVMAMLRIPTAESEGKANLHLGGMGIGIDIAKGVTTHAAQYHHMISELPHGGSPSGHQMPQWDDILLVCAKIQHVTNIGYLAVDITIDAQIGPAVLEVNARAGLSVQVANLAPLRARLERVQGLSVSSPEKGVRIGQDLFGEKVKKRRRKEAAPDERPVLGLKEVITIAAGESTFEEPCLIAPDRERTKFAEDLLSELMEYGAAEPVDVQAGTYRVKFTLSGKKIQTLVHRLSAPVADERVVIGRRDLSDFLIDPSRKRPVSVRQSTVKQDLHAVDRVFGQYDRDLLLLRHLKPSNISEELRRLRADRRYNPVFYYSQLPELEDAVRRLQEPVDSDCAIGFLLEKKRTELLQRIELLQARGDAERFTEFSVALYGKPTSSLIRAASAVLHNRSACDLPPPVSEFLSAEAAKEHFEGALKRYGLHEWKVSLRSKVVADCTVGGQSIYLRESARFTPLHIDALIKHEIETHILIAENGALQPYALFRRGCAGYLETQEGLATHNQNLVYGLNHEKRYNAPRNLLGVAFGMEHSFAETREYLQEELGYNPEKALLQAVAMKRGLADTSQPGAFTKSVVYFRGLRAIEKYLHEGGALSRLYIGRIALEDLSLVEEIPDIQPPLLLPDFLRKA